MRRRNRLRIPSSFDLSLEIDLMDSLRPNDEHWIPTHGALDWGDIRQALAEVNYSGAWTFEVIKGRNGETPEELARLTRALAEKWRL